MKKLAVILAILLFLAGSVSAEGMKILQLSDAGVENLPEGVSFEEGCLTISKPGDYMLSGSLSNGQIVVDCKDHGKVTLYLNGLSVHNETSAAILIGECDPRAVISTVDQTENTLSCGANLVFTDEDEPNGVIFSHSDLTLEGSGRLSVTAGAMDGIVSKDDLKISGGILLVEAVRHGLRGKDFVEISGGDLQITAGRDGIKSTAKGQPDRGYVQITGGTVSIVYGDEAIQVVTECVIENAKISFRPAAQ